MPPYKYVNSATSTLNGAITNVATTLVVTSALPFPTTPNFPLFIDSELMLVTAVAGATFTVTRAQEGTAAAAHSNLATVTSPLTATSLLNQSSYDARAYGATGDGTTDDTTAINSAITAANVGGGTVFIPLGTFLVTGLTLKNNVVLRGAGYGSVLKLKNATNASVIALQATAVRCGVENLRIDGNKANQTDGNSCYGIVSVGGGCSDCWVDGVWIENSLRSAIYMEGPRNRATRNVITGTGVSNGAGRTGIVFTGESVSGGFGIISHNYISGSSEYNIKLYIGSNSTVVTNNVCVDSTRFGIYVHNSSYVTVSDNVITGADEEGILIQADLTNSANYNTVSGNTITGGLLAGINIWNNGTGSVSGNAITGNTIAANAGYGIYLLTAKGTVVSGNVVAANGTNNAVGPAGLVMVASPHTVVTGNVFRNNGNVTRGMGIWSWDSGTASTDCVITGNRCYDDATGLQDYGIRSENASDYWVVVGNNVRNNTVAGISLVGANNTSANNIG